MAIFSTDALGGLIDDVELDGAAVVVQGSEGRL